MNGKDKILPFNQTLPDRCIIGHCEGRRKTIDDKQSFFCSKHHELFLCLMQMIPNLMFTIQDGTVLKVVLAPMET